MEQLGCYWTVIHEIWCFSFHFSKFLWEHLSFNEIRRQWRVLYMKALSHLWQYLAELFLEWEMLWVQVVEKVKTHILCSVPFFRKKKCHLWDNVEKYGGARGRRWQYGALRAGYVRLHERNHTPAPVHTHLCLHAQTHTHINMVKCVTLIAFAVQHLLRIRTSLLRYTYIASLVRI